MNCCHENLSFLSNCAEFFSAYEENISFSCTFCKYYDFTFDRNDTQQKVEDINAVADPVLDAVVFDMTSAVTKGDYDRASELLGQLLKKQEEPIMILGVISKELRRLYTARLALDSGKDKLWLMDLWNMRSDYPARLLLDAARKTTHEWCANSLALCQKLDRRMKSEKGIDREGELKLLLMQLAQRA